MPIVLYHLKLLMWRLVGQGIMSSSCQLILQEICQATVNLTMHGEASSSVLEADSLEAGHRVCRDSCTGWFLSTLASTFPVYPSKAHTWSELPFFRFLSSVRSELGPICLVWNILHFIFQMDTRILIPEALIWPWGKCL